MLKTYLQALLSRFYSKTTADKAEISGLSAIDVKNSVVIANGSVSPKDGYVVVDSEAVGTSSHATYIYQDLHLINGFRCAIPSGQTYSTFAPVKKGCVILADIADAEVKQVKVYGLVGGVIQSLTRFFGQFKGVAYVLS